MKRVDDQIHMVCFCMFLHLRTDLYLLQLCDNILSAVSAASTASTASTALKEIGSFNRNRKNPRSATGHRYLSQENHNDNSTSIIINHQYKNDIHRSLRLRTDQDSSFKFRPELVRETCKQRIDDFNYAYDRLPVEYQKQLDQIDEALKDFGYSLREPYGFSGSSIFQPWELTWTND